MYVYNITRGHHDKPTPAPARSARSRRLIQQLAGNAPSGHRGIQRGQGGLETHGTNVFRQKAQALGMPRSPWTFR